MIGVYTDKHIIKEFPKLYTFLIEKDVREEFLCGLNTIHTRRSQNNWWKNAKEEKRTAFSMFSWDDFDNEYGPIINWPMLFDEFYEDYDNIVPYKAITLIKVV